MSATGPLYAGSASAGGDWATISNATGAGDGNFAVNSNEGPGGGGHTPSQLVTSAHGFAIPSTAVIDGIMLEANVYGDTGSSDLTIQVGKSGKLSTFTPNYGQVWPNPAGYLIWGGSSALWGRSDWTPADINNSSFGASISAFASHATGTIKVDAVRITVYWHPAPTKIPQSKYPLYKVFDSQTNAYLGNLPNVSSIFALSQDIDTAGAQITVSCAVSADTSGFQSDILTDEAGVTLTDESSNVLTDEGSPPPTGVGTSGALIRDGNRVEAWEYSYYYPNGVCLFRGQIERHTDNFGGDTGDDNVTMLIYSDSSDLDNYLVRGNPYTYTADVTQGASNAFATLLQNAMGAGWNRYGQTWKVGAGVTNLDAINLAFGAGYADVTVSVYTSSALTTLLGSVTQNVNIGTETVITFAFPNPIVTTPASTYFFAISVAAGQSIPLVYQTTNVYANGAMYNSSYGGGGGGSYGALTGDLYFTTYSGTGSTLATFTGDPSTGMLQTIMNDYRSRGGLVGVGNIGATGLSLTYGFNTNTIYEGLKGTLSVSPAGFYYYVDLGTNLLYFQQANTGADYVLTKGVHISKLSIVSTIEYVINACYVVGASGVYTLDTDPASIARYGLRMTTHTDNNIPNDTTAHAVGSSIVAASKDEQYQTSVTIPAGTMDITLLVPGKVIGFNGFGTYVDGLLAQIVHRDYAPESVTLTLGILPKRTTLAVEQTVRGLTALSTISNPSSPS